MKRRVGNWFSVMVVLLIGAGIATYLWYTGNLSFTRTIYYPDFGIGIPRSYNLHGIDVSRYQKEIHWKEVKEMHIRGVKVDFVFIKSSEGLSHCDLLFKRNWLQARQHGILRGCYHYFHPAQDPVKQATFFIANSDLQPGDLPPVADIEVTEELPQKKLCENLKRFLDVLENKYKCKPIIYTYADFYKNNLDTSFNEYPFWVAHYKNGDEPKTNRQWNFWQFSDCATVNGISSKVDFNVFKGDSVALQKLRIK